MVRIAFCTGKRISTLFLKVQTLKSRRYMIAESGTILAIFTGLIRQPSLKAPHVAPIK